MYYKPHEINQIAEDQLGREELIINLNRLINSSPSPFVLCINAGWGMGKTTFLKFWQARLKDNNQNLIHFNAWESDYSESPLIAFISEIEDTLKKKLDESKTKIDSLLKSGKRLFKQTIPIFIRATSNLATGSEDLAKLLEKLTESQYQDYKASKQTIKEFQSNLEASIKEINETDKNGRPLIFFIDELDRCRPTFAIELLENIKHFFATPGIVFVLAMDREQLAHSIKALYGSEMDAYGYLNRFIDLEFNLPNPISDDYIEMLYSNSDLEESLQKRKYGNSDRDRLLSSFKVFCKIFNLSLRDQAQCFSRISLAFRSTAPHEFIRSEFIVFLITLKFYNLSFYKKYLGGEKTWETFSAIEKLPFPQKFRESIEWNSIKFLTLSSVMVPEDSKPILIELEREFKRGGLEEKRKREIEQFISVRNHYNRILPDYDFSDPGKVRDYLLRKLEFLDQFTTETN